MTTDTHLDLGNDVPAICTHPDCDTQVHRGIVHICGMDPAGAGVGCGLHFCGPHLVGPDQTCERCAVGDPPFSPKEIVPEFPEWRMTGAGWEEWRKNNPELVARTYAKYVAKLSGEGPTPPFIQTPEYTPEAPDEPPPEVPPETEPGA